MKTKITMMLPNPSKSNDVFVFSRKKYVLLTIECGICVMLSSDEN